MTGKLERIEPIKTLTDNETVKLLLKWKYGEITDDLKLELPYIHKYIEDFEGDSPGLSMDGEDFLEQHKELVEQLKIELGLRNKIQIELPCPGKLISTFAEEVGKFFQDKNLVFYRPSEKCVVKLEMIAINKEKDKKILSFQEVKKEDFVTFIERYFEPGIMIKAGEDAVFKPKSITKDQADITLASSQFRNYLPIIDRIFNVPMPVLNGNRLSFPQAGYDPDLWSWLPLDAPRINPDMTVEEAKSILNDTYKEFCFKNPQDKTNSIAGLLTPFIRGLYPRMTCRSPIFFYKANRERAGKDYDADITGIVYYGVANDEPPLADGKETHDEEFRKKILSEFIAGRNRIHLSNNKGVLNSAQLENIATAENFSDRLLGTNVELTFPNTLEISLSANTGITYTPDLAGRCVFINLFLALEDPNKRQFERPDLHEWVKNHRSEILSALYALVKNWYDKGMPPEKTLFSSFPDWARVCGGIMEAADLGDPCVNNDDQTSIGGDTETRDMKRLFELCYEKWPEEPILKKQIMDEITTPDTDFSDLFSWFDWSNIKSAGSRFAFLIKKFVGRELGGITLIEDENEKRASRKKYTWSKIPKKEVCQTTLPK